MEPVYKKMSTAFENIAKENGYSFILTSTVGGQDVLLYADAKLDTSDQVLKKFGVTPSPAK